MGVSPEMKWIEIGFESLFWKIKLRWQRAKLFFGPEWNNFSQACKLGIDDKCIFTNSAENMKFEVAVYHKDKSDDVYKEGKYPST